MQERRHLIVISLALVWYALLCGCACMQDPYRAYESKPTQQALIQVGAFMDTFRAQDPRHYSYRIVKNAAVELMPACRVLGRVSTDSYMLRMAGELEEQAELLAIAATRRNPKTTEEQLERVLKTWDVLEDYVRPKEWGQPRRIARQLQWTR